MGQYIDGNERTFTAGGALDQYLRVKLSSGKLAAAGIGDKDLGVTTRAAFADGDDVAVRLRNCNGTTKGIAAKAIAVGDTVYTAASGKFSDAQGTGAFEYGVALSAASGNGSVFEILPNAHGDTAGS